MDMGFRPTMDEINMIFRKYNINYDGYLKYSEFSDAFFPSDPHYARLLSSKRINYPRTNE